MAVTWGTLPHYGQGQESAQHVQAVASASDSHSSSVLASASAYAPPGRRLVLVSGSACTVLLHNVVDGCCLHALTDPSGPVISLGLVNDLLAILVQNDGLSVYRCEVAGRAGGGLIRVLVSKSSWKSGGGCTHRTRPRSPSPLTCWQWAAPRAISHCGTLGGGEGGWTSSPDGVSPPGGCRNRQGAGIIQSYRD